MKMTFLTPHLKISGGVKIICEYARRLAEQGHQVTLLAKDRHPTWRGLLHSLSHTIKWIDLNKVTIKFIPEFNPRYFPEGDAIFATSWQTAQPVNAADDTKGKKFYLIQHMENLISRDSAQVKPTYRLPLIKIVVSQWLKERLEVEFQQSSHHIPNAIDHDAFFPTDKTYDSKRIVMLHHTAEWKGINDGIQAIAIAQKKIPDIQLVLFGVRRKNLDNVNAEYHYYLNPNKLRKLYSSCNLFLCPSWYEGFGLPGLEAMACQTALVTTDTGGCRDYAINNETALISKPKNPQALADNITRALTDMNLLKKLSASGHRMAQKFKWSESVDKMEQIIRDAL